MISFSVIVVCFMKSKQHLSSLTTLLVLGKKWHFCEKNESISFYLYTKKIKNWQIFQHFLDSSKSILLISNKKSDIFFILYTETNKEFLEKFQKSHKKQHFSTFSARNRPPKFVHFFAAQHRKLFSLIFQIQDFQFSAVTKKVYKFGGLLRAENVEKRCFFNFVNIYIGKMINIFLKNPALRTSKNIVSPFVSVCIPYFQTWNFDCLKIDFQKLDKYW